MGRGGSWILREDPEEASREIRLCHPDRGMEGVVRFFENHLKIKDKGTHEVRPFKLWPAQVDVLSLLTGGSWVFIVKARQLGLTWLVAGYALWKLLYLRFYTAVVINQSLKYAQEFYGDKVNFMYNHCPSYFQIPKDQETTQMVKFGFNGVYRLESNLHALAGNEDSARSFTGNLFVADEAARIKQFDECFRAAEPTLKNANGQACVLSSSRGPRGRFYLDWRRIVSGSDANREVVLFEGTEIRRTERWWVGVFLPWSANPNRDKEWYRIERDEHEDDSDYMRREFPTTAEEAFQSAGGRVYPRFSELPFGEGGHVHRFKGSEINSLWPRYRGIDWGETASAFVCLWVMEIPSDKPCLTVDPSCVNLIAELLGYSYGEDSDEPVKQNDHGPDALRYIVTSFDLTQWVHVYRELYVYDAVGKGHTTQTLCARIREMSGWDPVPSGSGPLAWMAGEAVEDFEGTVYDRQRAMLGNELAEYDIEAIPHRSPISVVKLDKVEEKREGRIMVNKLVVGALPLSNVNSKSERQLETDRLMSVDWLRRAGVRTSRTLSDSVRRRKEIARMKRSRHVRGGIHPYLGGRW